MSHSAQPPLGPPQQPPPKQGMSTGGKVGIGCSGCFGILLLLFVFAGCMSVMTADTSSTRDAEADATEEVEPDEDEREDEDEDEEDQGEDDEEEEEAEPAEEEAADEGADAEQESAPETVANGVHRVGEDIEPGTYTTDGPDADDLFPSCYYARLSGVSGEFDDIISNNNIEGPGTVVVEEGDEALELSGGCEWTLE